MSDRQDEPLGDPGERSEPGTSLPEPVRLRVVELASWALSRLPADQVPGTLKRVASFAPARRPRLAGLQIAAVLETDSTFRERVGDEVQAELGELHSSVLEGALPAGGDPVEVAVAVYLLRPPGWQRLLEAAVAGVESVRRPAGGSGDVEEVDRLRRRMTELEAENQRLRTRGREQLERLKAEHAEARRRLGETRVRLREAQAAAETQQAEASGEVATARQATGVAEAEVRRLRARVGELESELASARRAERVSRIGETVRARLLLETLVNAAQGLQRELALPAVDRLPADAVTDAGPEAGVRLSTGRGSLSPHDPGLLEELLRMPRAHLVVDGYNVTKTAWPELTLERQRERLLSGVAALQSRVGAELTVVFDAAESSHRPLVTPPRGVRVWFSPAGVIADDLIRDVVAAEPAGRVVVVATSDQALAGDVVAAGFHVVPAASLAGLLPGGRS